MVFLDNCAVPEDNLLGDEGQVSEVGGIHVTSLQ